MDNLKTIEEFMQVMREFHKLILPKNISDTENSLTPLQLEALLYLRIHPKSIVSTLGKYLQLSSSATAQLTDRLAKVGFIKREDDLQDRRAVLLSLTPKGDRVSARVHKAHMEKIKGLLASIPEKNINELTQIFKKFHQEFEGKKK